MDSQTESAVYVVNRSVLHNNERDKLLLKFGVNSGYEHSVSTPLLSSILYVGNSSLSTHYRRVDGRTSDSF